MVYIPITNSMAYKKLTIAAIIFFLLVNTSYYWEGKVSFFLMIIFILLFVYFIVLTVLLIWQIVLSIKEKLKNKKRIFSIIIVAAVLILAIFFPYGAVNFERFESDTILIAEREGAANCMITLKLREDGSFKSRDVCFGITEIIGTYKIKGDTIFFNSSSTGSRNEKYNEYAIIRQSEAKNDLIIGSKQSEFELLLVEPSKKWVYIDNNAISKKSKINWYLKFDKNMGCENLTVSDNSKLINLHPNEEAECLWKYNKGTKRLTIFDYNFIINNYTDDTIYMKIEETNRDVLFINVNK